MVHFMYKNIPAAFMWNWTIDAGSDGVVSGTLMTSQDYSPGAKDITAFEVIDNAMFDDLFEGEYTPDAFSTPFSWDGTSVAMYDFIMLGNDGFSVVDCISGARCFIQDSTLDVTP